MYKFCLVLLLVQIVLEISKIGLPFECDPNHFGLIEGLGNTIVVNLFAKFMRERFWCILLQTGVLCPILVYRGNCQYLSILKIFRFDLNLSSYVIISRSIIEIWVCSISNWVHPIFLSFLQILGMLKLTFEYTKMILSIHKKLSMLKKFEYARTKFWESRWTRHHFPSQSLVNICR